jgi:hypothetical protein
MAVFGWGVPSLVEMSVVSVGVLYGVDEPGCIGCDACWLAAGRCPEGQKERGLGEGVGWRDFGADVVKKLEEG